MFDMMKIKAMFPRYMPLLDDFDNQVETNAKENLLRTLFEVPDIGLKTLRDLTSKDIYKILISQNEPYINSKDYWKYEMFPGLDLDWDVWFKVNFNSKILPRKCKDFNLKLFHGWLSTESRLSRMGYSDGLCKCCQREKENVEHLLINCQYRLQVWKLLEKALRKSFDNIFSLSRKEIIAGFFQKTESNETQIINMCIGITRFHLWKTRNSIREDDETITYINCSMFLKHKIIDHVNILLSSETTDGGIKQLLPKVVDGITEVFAIDNM